MCKIVFEDRVLKSDIVFVRTFVSVEVKEYYNPINNLLIKDIDVK